jgi:transcriptional regulator with XRE-family HTH domain
MAVEDTRAREFGHMIRGARERLGWTQEDLADKSRVSLTTIKRYENGKIGTPDPDMVRKVFRALGLDVREAPVALGFVTREEMGLPPKEEHSPTVLEVISILEDPNVDDREKAEWVRYLKFRTRDQRSPRRRTG